MKVGEILKNRTKWMPNEQWDQMKPVVSVLLPTWKRAESGLFEEAVNSVLNQTYQNLELIIVDDCSTDGTFEIIQNYMKIDSRVSCIRHTENIGLPAISEFEAYAKSRGTYIAFMFDDNEWEEDGIENLVRSAEESKVKAIAGKYKLFIGTVNDSFSDQSKWQIIGGSHICLSNLLLSNQFGHGSVLLHRDTIEKVGFFDPNVATSRCWDWDLWSRISQYFEFKMTDFMIGKEKGCGLEDSLGNTHKVYNWAAQERIHQPKNEELLSENYYENDIFDVKISSSPMLYRSNLWLAKQYEKKPWFDSKDKALLAIEEKSQKPWHGQRILFLNGSLTVNASSSLNWGRLPYDPNYVVFYSALDYMVFDAYKADWLYADMLVVERAINSSILERVVDWGHAFGIKCYYYADDNFKTLAEDYKGTKYFKNMAILAKDITEENIKRFDGVFTSTKALKNYYLEGGLHDNVHFIEPIIDMAQVQPYHKLKKPLNMLFFGSGIRGELLIETVFPAIQKISEDFKINFHCPDETYFELKGRMLKKFPNLQLTRFSRTLDLDTALKRLKNIHIQLHCGPQIQNNTYKTANALLNALTLGATLIATADHPYSDLPTEKPVCLLAENTTEAWEKAIRQMCDAQLHQEIYENAMEYCQKTYASHWAIESIEAMSEGNSHCGLMDMSRRLMEFNSALINNINHMSGHIAAISGTTTPSGMLVETKGAVDSAIFLSALSYGKFKKALNFAEKDWTHGGNRGIYRFLPLVLSQPISAGNYEESKLKSKMKQMELLLVAPSNTRVVLEFTENNMIIEQLHIQVHGIQKISVSIPDNNGNLRLRVANCTAHTNLHIVKRKLFSRTMFDFKEVMPT